MSLSSSSLLVRIMGVGAWARTGEDGWVQGCKRSIHTYSFNHLENFICLPCPVRGSGLDEVRPRDKWVWRCALIHRVAKAGLSEQFSEGLESRVRAEHKEARCSSFSDASSVRKTQGSEDLVLCRTKVSQQPGLPNSTPTTSHLSHAWWVSAFEGVLLQQRPH